jgi:two-component system CheB/CheR fusion protein
LHLAVRVMATKKTRSQSPKSGDGRAGKRRKPGQGGQDSRRIKRPRCTIVGVGASAGGLEACSEMLNHLPPEPGLALVLVQHLDPRHSSSLVELLSRTTRMPVLAAQDGMVMEADHVYVIPPNASLTTADGMLLLVPRPIGHQMPIDVFFRSLAEAEGSNAIGVILSGTASDGTLGLQAIKAEGGITFSQDEKSAKYDGMPRSAIATGCVDFVLPPRGIADELVRLCRHPYVALAHAEEAASSEPDFKEIFAILRAATGVDFTAYKYATIRRRILRRMALVHVDNPQRYLQFIRENRGEVQALFQDILIGVTGFFREPGMFDLLTSRVFPVLFRDPGYNPVRVWVPGCSTGEEAYSIGIALLEYARDHGGKTGIQIFGTDLSEPSLEKARTGLYPETIVGDLSSERLREFFVKRNGNYQVTRALRDTCIFARQNLLRDPPFSRLDLITCRNVLIYFGAELQQKLMRVFHYALKPSRFLVLGVSETVGPATNLFHHIDPRQKIYTRNTIPNPIGSDLGAHHMDSPEPLRIPIADMPPSIELYKKIDQLLLSRYSPPGVVIDGDLKILQFRGRTAPYLEHTAGEANLNLLKMSRGTVGMEVRKLIARARLKEGTFRSEPLFTGRDQALRQVRLTVTAVRATGMSEPQYVVLFEDVPEETQAGKKSRKKPPETTPVNDSRRKELEQELGSIKVYLQSVIEEHEAATEELKSANEEIQSSNEELQSTNEELLTAKEELQSTNEELTTVNQEMQGRNAELTQINNDLNNLLNSVKIPIVMLGNDLRIRWFTPQAEKVFNLLPTDVGRRISDFKPKINVPELEQLFLNVIDTLTIHERDVQDQEGHMYSMWIRPYRTADNRIDGVVMVLLEISERKHMAESRESDPPTPGDGD